ncbi:MAG: FecR family protein [Opitutaceae bacterium]|jgi:hypothetical protein
MRLNTFFYTVSLALLLAVNLPAQTVRVIFVSGQAELQRPDEAAPHPVMKGESVIVGTRISTGADGRVVLTPMPGVKSIIAPNTVIVLESASDSQTSPTEVKHQAVIDLKVGSVVSDLQKQPGATFDYSIRTPRGLAGARGTTFTVGLNDAGIQTIIVSHGTITLNLADGRTVSLTMGQVSITQPGGGTANGGKSSDLSAEDQALAEASMTATLQALADAVEQGVELQGDALANALATAESLGIKIPDDLKQRVQTLIDNPPAPKVTDPDPIMDTELPPDDVLNPDTVDTEVLPPDLTSEQQEVFRSLSPEAKAVILKLADHAITVAVLTPDTDTGLTLANADIVRNLAALVTLKNTDPTGYELFLELAGYNAVMPASVPRGVNGGNLLPFLDSAPGPTEWSVAAFSRTAAMWNSTDEGALTSGQKRDLVSLGAGQIVMDRSAGYLSALLDTFNALDQPQRDALQSAGWGKYLDGVANNPTTYSLTAALDIISAYTPAQLTALKDFNIGFQEVLEGENNYQPVGALLTAVGTALGDDVTTLRQMSANGNILELYFKNEISPEALASRFAEAVAYFKALPADQQKAIRELGVGTMLLVSPPNDILGYAGDTSFTSGERVAEILAFYTSLPTDADRETLRDMSVFQDPSGIEFFSYGAFNSGLLTSAITAYKDLNTRTRDYLASEANHYSFFQLFVGNSPVGPPSIIPTLSDGPMSPSYRSLVLINALLDGLTEDQYGALLDLDAGRAIFEVAHLGDSAEDTTVATSLPSLTTFLDFYNTGLGNTQKSTLRELGIVGEDNIAFLGSDPADHTGLGRLLTAYSELSGTLRAQTEKLDENSVYYTHFGNSEEIKDRSYFFPYGETQTTLYNVSFEAAGDLYVGATKYLVIDNTYDEGVTFTTAYQGNLALRASNLIDLTSTTFSSGVRTITMEAATINLTNINFPGGAGVYLNSKLGGTSNGTDGSGKYPHFGSSAYGRVNFIGGVSYGGNPITNTSEFDAHGADVHIGTLANPKTPFTNPPPSTPVLN